MARAVRADAACRDPRLLPLLSMQPRRVVQVVLRPPVLRWQRIPPAWVSRVAAEALEGGSH
eukprot:11415265-Alexandrium_andersonii.AAC.1